MGYIPGAMFGYIPNYPCNIIGCVLFGIIAIVQFVLGIYTRDWWMWVTWTLTAGGECAGYVARVILHNQYTSTPMWEMQLVLTIIMPAFMSAGLYYQLAVQTVVYGEQYSLMKPMIYNAIFTTCDVISLFVQAAGGGVASSGSANSQNTVNGSWIMLGGIAFQVATLVAFILVAGWVNYRIFSDNPDNWNPKYKQQREKFMFKVWPFAVAVSLLFLLIRSIYRIVELADGWHGYIIETERYFLILDGLMIVIGMVPLTIIYPGLAYGRVAMPGLHKEAEKPMDDEFAQFHDVNEELTSTTDDSNPKDF